MITYNWVCPRGHRRLEFIAGLTAVMCLICDKLYVYGELKNRP